MRPWLPSSAVAGRLPRQPIARQGRQGATRPLARGCRPLTAVRCAPPSLPGAGRRARIGAGGWVGGLPGAGGVRGKRRRGCRAALRPCPAEQSIDGHATRRCGTTAA
eukprot:363243-Chlamydomonas_euryale.AAC.11